jgi:hypothetical protein
MEKALKEIILALCSVKCDVTKQIFMKRNLAGQLS